MIDDHNDNNNNNNDNSKDNSNNTDSTNDNNITFKTRCGFAVSPGLQAKVDGFRKAIETHLPKDPASKKHPSNTTCLTHIFFKSGE